MTTRHTPHARTLPSGTFALVAACAALALSCNGPELADTASNASGASPAPSAPPSASEHPGTLGEPPHPPCADTCASLRNPCGRSLTSCGTVITCGPCPEGETCGGGGVNRCGTDACEPLTCAAAGATCGMISDGCGEVLDCGGCPDGEACVGQVCTCTPTTCAAAGASCGSISDGCGETLECGTCDPGSTCQNNTCACAPTTCAAAGASCGSISDGCGDTIDCGGCPDGTSCANHQCCAAQETCGNGVDDDCDGQTDDGCVTACESTEGNGCNEDDGDGDRCDPSDNEYGCAPDRFWAWCNRRNGAYPNIWDNYLRDWVDDRCDGTVSLQDPNDDGYPTFVCTDSQGRRWECTTPLVLAFDEAGGVSYVRGPEGFALEPSSGRTAMAWPSADNPWLAMDANRNGVIDDGAELFGSSTPMGSGRAPRNGFEPLAELDGNRDGFVDAADARWGDLLVWADRDGDGRSSPGELATAAESGLLAISLQVSIREDCDGQGRCTRERAAFQWLDGARLRTGMVVDVYLPVRR